MNYKDSFHLEIQIYFLDLRVFCQRIPCPATYLRKLSDISNQEYKISVQINTYTEV